ncbi:COG3650 family protein [Marinibacterium profundimaris]|uniref:SH3b domain-containing protein n=1 Tax=Marinibacterium profundimaris TaxID=1679460 RepID=A0A225NP90_9RHOB|nr:SH3 domain-containing protein [Marinibacterium profundimaris]OWU75740.1 hypothetical protein ATO3_05940 [Marinibacterium profundimaris]
MRRLAALLLAFGLTAGTLQADPVYPWLYDVIGVSADDVLNLRAGPSSEAEVIGALAHDATGIEVVGINDNGYWLQIALPESTAWAATGFLAPQPHDPELAFTRILDCGGTEPFWGLQITQGTGATLSRMDKADADLPAGRVRPSPSMKNQYFLDLGERHAAMLTTKLCSDGMSDRAYGLSIRLVIDETETMHGCCSLRP